MTERDGIEMPGYKATGMLLLSPPVASATAPSISTSTPRPAVRPLPRAKDGTNLRACYDGRCEVLVTKPVDITLNGRRGVDILFVTAIDSDGVDFQTISASGFTGNLLEQRPDQGGPSTINRLAVSVVAISGRRAVIRLSPA